MAFSDLLYLSLAIIWLTLCTVAPMWAATDAARLPNSAWAKTDKDKWIWVVLPPLATLLCGVGGLVLAWSYFKHVRPLVLAQTSTRPPTTF